MTPFLHEDARMRLQQIASAAGSGYLQPTFQTVNIPNQSSYKQPFTIDNIIGHGPKSSIAITQSMPQTPLPAFASQFASSLAHAVPSSLMIPYPNLRQSEAELLSSLACTYGQVNVNPLDYRNILKSSLHHSPAIPIPIKPAALPAISLVNSSDNQDKPILKPPSNYSIEAMLKPSPEPDVEKNVKSRLNETNIIDVVTADVR